LPYGDKIYKYGQKHYGQLRVDPTVRLSAQVEMLRWLAKAGMPAAGKRYLEVGTGHIPVVPIGFYLAGADQTITVDLNRRIDWPLTRETLEWMATHRSELTALYSEETVAREVFDERFAKLIASKENPREFLQQARIKYLAPGDAANTHLPSESVDCHYSMTVLEHIPEVTLRDILLEAKRILKPDGFALHFIDPSDHFQHQDSTITPINFLKYSDEDWNRIAGNQFAYCNRLRASDFLNLIAETNLNVVRSETRINEQSKNILGQGFTIDDKFRHYSTDDLCTTTLNVLLKK
jgi:SAM-dependent methyltransferase